MSNYYKYHQENQSLQNLLQFRQAKQIILSTFSPSNILPCWPNCVFGLTSNFGIYFSQDSGIFLLFLFPQPKIYICINVVYLLQINIIPLFPDAHMGKAATHNDKITNRCLENFQRSLIFSRSQAKESS